MLDNLYENEVDCQYNPLLLTFNVLKDQIALQKATLQSMTKQLKLIEKQLYKNIKVSDKIKEKQVKNKTRKTGLTKPMKISQQLADFIGVNVEDKIARTDVTKKLSKYIKEYNLQKNTDKRVIIPNESLMSLFKEFNAVEPLTYFNLQKHISHHYSDI